MINPSVIAFLPILPQLAHDVALPFSALEQHDMSHT